MWADGCFNRFLSSSYLCILYPIYLSSFLAEYGVDERETSRTKESLRPWHSRVPLFTSSLPSACNPFLSAVFPMGNVVTYRSSWKPRQSRWKLNRGTVSSLPLTLSAFSDIAFRPLFLSLFANMLTYSHLALFVVSKLSLAPSCSFLSPRQFLCLHLPIVPTHEILVLAHPRFPVAWSR